MMMEYMSEQIRVYHSLYLYFLSGALLCLVTAGILFVRLDIGSVVRFFTGRQKKSRMKLSFLIDREVILVNTDERI